MDKKLKILMAADGSDQSLNAVRYIGGAFSAGRVEVVLFSVRASVPESFLDLRKEAAFRSTMLSISAWESQTKRDLDAFMSKAKDVLMKADFPDKAVSIHIQPKKVGIARDILQESLNGYDAVVVGRTGISRIKDFVLGSVANKLVGKTPHIPIVVVGGDPSPKKVLVGFDGSEGANRAVSVVSTMIDPANCSVTLCHVIRRLNLHLAGEFFFTPDDEHEWVDQAKKDILPQMQAAENRLVNAGFHPSEVFVQILDEEVSRASKLVKNATGAGMGTIVVGRRGLSMVEEFVLGRVSTKVLSMAQNMAVWIA
ncbi:MAG: universal stress protein [Desulfobacterales bacterium]|nr:universal stress protein [Desulfobacterales bacterium]